MYKRLYRKLHRDKTAKQKYRAGVREGKARARMLAWHRRYNAERRAHKAQQMKEQWRARHPLPQPKCRGCGREIPFCVDGERVSLDNGTAGCRPPLRCVFCISKYQLRAAVRRWIVRADREIAAGPAPKPKKVKPWVPRQRPTRFNAAGERLCWTATCRVVVNGREKKCGACKRREADDAARTLCLHQGRGRRTDLERSAA